MNGVMISTAMGLPLSMLDLSRFELLNEVDFDAYQREIDELFAETRRLNKAKPQRRGLWIEEHPAAPARQAVAQNPVPTTTSAERDAIVERRVAATFVQADAQIAIQARAFGFGDDTERYVREMFGSLAVARVALQQKKPEAEPRGTRAAVGQVAALMGPSQQKELAAWRVRQQGAGAP